MQFFRRSQATEEHVRSFARLRSDLSPKPSYPTATNSLDAPLKDTQQRHDQVVSSAKRPESTAGSWDNIWLFDPLGIDLGYGIRRLQKIFVVYPENIQLDCTVGRHRNANRALLTSDG